MSDLIETKVKDSYKEHESYHQSSHNDCSECFKKNRIIKAHRIVNNKTHEDLLKKYPALNNPYGRNLPTGFRPE